MHVPARGSGGHCVRQLVHNEEQGMPKSIGILLAAAAVLWSAATAEARPQPERATERGRARIARTAKDDLKWITVGNLGALVTNYGRFGDADLPRQSSYDWPSGSLNDYLYEGRLWFGAMVGGTPLVSQADSPPALEWGSDPTAAGDTIRMITGAEARGDLDTYCEFTDKMAENTHQIGVKVKQRTSTWTASYLDDIILYDMTFENISDADLTDCYIGITMDGDISSAEGGSSATQWSIDDLTYYTKYTVGSDTRFISYEYDGDNPARPGDDTGGPEGQCKGYLGTTPIIIPAAADGKTPANLPVSHYWWDWNHDPSGDDMRYSYMASHEFLPPPPSPFDYRYLQAYGPYNIAAGDTVRVMFAHGIGEGLSGLKDNLNAIHDLARANSTTVGKWKGSESPPAPSLSVVPGSGRVTLKWSPASESHIDPVSNVADFAGYRVWKSRTGVEGTWTLIADFDKVDDYGLNTGLAPLVNGTYEFVDTQVHDGFGYWYAVTVYDRGDQQIGVLESSQNSNKAEVFPGPTGDNSGSNIYVYPDPYRFQSSWDPTPDAQRPASNRIRFNNIPGRCTIRIFTMAGDLVATLEHADGTGYHDWDFMSDRPQPQKIVAGVYLYSIRGEGVDYVGKFVVLR